MKETGWLILTSLSLVIAIGLTFGATWLYFAAPSLSVTAFNIGTERDSRGVGINSLPLQTYRYEHLKEQQIELRRQIAEREQLVKNVPLLSPFWGGIDETMKLLLEEKAPPGWGRSKGTIR